MTCNCALAGAL